MNLRPCTLTELIKFRFTWYYPFPVSQPVHISTIDLGRKFSQKSRENLRLYTPPLSSEFGTCNTVGQILALAFMPNFLTPFKVFPSRSKSVGANLFPEVEGKHEALHANGAVFFCRI